MDIKDQVALLCKHLAHDLHYGTATYKTNLAYSLSSLAPALPSQEEAEASWGGKAFSVVEADLVRRVEEEIDRQLGGATPEFRAWKADFLRAFPHVEYMVNAGLLYALARLDGRALHQLIGSVLAGPALAGSTLAVAQSRPDTAGIPGWRWYHVAQDDGCLIGPACLVLLELKAVGRTRKTLFQAAQLAKLAWLAENTAPGAELQRRVLIVLPRGRDGGVRGLATDVVLDPATKSVRPKTRCNKGFGAFLEKVGWSRREAEAAIEQVNACVITYSELASVMGAMSGGSPVLEAVEKDLEHVAWRANPPAVAWAGRDVG